MPHFSKSANLIKKFTFFNRFFEEKFTFFWGNYLQCLDYQQLENIQQKEDK